MGEVFAGRYELVDPIGSGGMGSVWRTFDHRENAFCAAKVLRQSDATTILRFIREQSLRIQHPHVVAPRNWAGEDDRVLFTMDLVRGGSTVTALHDHGPLPSFYVAVLLEQLLAALDAVHGAGVVHRDVKPANLLLEPTGVGRPVGRLTDFGIAVKRDEPRLTSTGMVIGTPGYLAPEAFHGEDPEPRQDLYSAGLTVVELLTGVKPRTVLPGPEQAPEAPAEPAAQTLGARDAPAVPSAPPDGVDPGLWDLVRRLSSADAESRPATAAAARDELLQLPDARRPGTPLVAPPGVLEAWRPGADPVEIFDQVGPVPEQLGPSAAGRPPHARPEQRPYPRSTGQPGGPAGPAGPTPPRPGAAAVGHAAPQPGGSPDARPTVRQQHGTVPMSQRLPGAADGRPTESVPGRSGVGRRTAAMVAVVMLVALLVGSAAGLAATRFSWPVGGLGTSENPKSENEGEAALTDGSRCTFVEVGEHVERDGDDPLTCVRTDDGDYRWRTAD